MQRTDRKLLQTSSIKMDAAAKAYTELRQTVITEGILERDYLYYAMNTLFGTAGFSFSLYQLFTTSQTPFVIFWSLILAFFSVQLSGSLHDAGHRAMFKSTVWNDVAGFLYSTPFGMGYSNWKWRHNMHHAHPNEEDEDPDINIPILSFSEEQIKSKKGIERFLTRYQVYLYYILGLFVFISFRLKSLDYFFKDFSLKKVPELLIFTIGNIFWFTAPFFLFPFPKALLIVVVVNLSTGIYMLNIFAPNHKGMPQIKKGAKISFLEQQILTTRNVEGNWLNDFVYLGLNYQIEHHLFPNCPRSKLNLITPHVVALCKKLDLEYTRVTPLQQNQIILAELHQVSRLR